MKNIDISFAIAHLDVGKQNNAKSYERSLGKIIMTIIPSRNR